MFVNSNPILGERRKKRYYYGMIQFDEDKQNQRLHDLHDAEEEEFTRMVAEKQGKEYIDLSKAPIDPDALRLVFEKDAREGNVVVFSMQDKHIRVAHGMDITPKTQAVFDALIGRGYTLQPYLVSHSSLNRGFGHYKELSFAVEAKSGSLDISNEEIAELLGQVQTIGDIKKRIDAILTEKKSYKISRVVEIIIAGALATEASDIHIEPEDVGAVLRYRLDGVLNIVLHFDRETYDLIVNRVKLLSGIKINVRNNSQDGRFSVQIKEDVVDLRVSTLPGSNGESAVLRVLNPKTLRTSVEDMGIEPMLLGVLLRAVEKPNGMILTTGPTGSGKTTTLYAFLRKVYSPETKIITIENPVEYRIPGIVQSQTDPEHGFTFLHGLRAAVRQDPDIIMIGEIRDEETAQTAIDAALTGHLVFSTLHTNNAAGAYTRFIELGVNPKVITSALTISIAQRLVRKLCPFCKKEIAPSPEDKQIIEEVLASIKNREHQTVVNTIWTSVGCEKCNMTGFKGRIGIFEAIVSDETVEQILTTNPSEREIQKVSENQGFLNLRQDGVMKILAGISSVHEVNRVIDLHTGN